MKKLIAEFRKFINRGNVMDLAVGMIIGSAFTAIITSVVNGIFKPLINWIPIGKTGLQTILRPATLDESGNILTEALILDWGGVISAIITFILTALVLFIIVKIFNNMKDASEKAKEKLAKIAQKQKEDEEAAAAEAAAAEAAAEAEQTANQEPTETVEDLLRQIRDALAAQRE